MSSLMPGQALAYAEPCHLGGLQGKAGPSFPQGDCTGSPRALGSCLCICVFL